MIGEALSGLFCLPQFGLVGFALTTYLISSGRSHVVVCPQFGLVVAVDSDSELLRQQVQPLLAGAHLNKSINICQVKIKKKYLFKKNNCKENNNMILQLYIIHVLAEE